MSVKTDFRWLYKYHRHCIINVFQEFKVNQRTQTFWKMMLQRNKVQLDVLYKGCNQSCVKHPMQH